MTLIPKGAHLASATVPWHELFFLPRPENQGIFWSASNKKYQIPDVALVDFNPDGRHCLFHSFSLPSSILKVLNNMQKRKESEQQNHFFLPLFVENWLMKLYLSENQSFAWHSTY